MTERSRDDIDDKSKVMSEVRTNADIAGGMTSVEQGGPAQDEPFNPDSLGIQDAGHPSSAAASPSPSAESGLLSLPWELVTHIASHLPAQCVISVLPQVCQTLGNVGKDSTAWQLRARRLTGSQARFPVGPRDDFDWPVACVEMEQLTTCWTNHAHLLARENQEDKEDIPQMRQQQREGKDMEVNPEDDVRLAEEEEGAGVLALEAAYGADEGVDVAVEGEDDEVQPIEGEDQLASLRDVLEVERDHRVQYDANEGHDAAPNHQEDMVDPRNEGDGGEAAAGHYQPPRSPSPPPALECFTVHTDHIAQVNSVFLLGDDRNVCATGSRDWNVKLWDLKAKSRSAPLQTLGSRGNYSTHQGWVWCLASQGSELASGGFDSTVKLWDLQAGGAERGVIRTGAAVLCLQYQTNLLLVGAFDKRVSMYDTRVAEPLVKSVRLHSNAVMCLAADDNYIISGSKDCTMVVYDCRADKILKKIRLRSYLLSMSYCGSEVWAGDNKGMLHSFSMQAGTLKPLSRFDVGHTAVVTGIHNSPGALYTCSSDCTVKVHIPCAPPRTLCTLRHQAGVNGLSVNAGVLAVASGDMSVEVWRPRK